MNKKFLTINILIFLILPLNGMAQLYNFKECNSYCQKERAACGARVQLPEDVIKCQIEMGKCEEYCQKCHDHCADEFGKCNAQARLTTRIVQELENCYMEKGECQKKCNTFLGL